jgi:hypothetical protein
MPSTPVEMVKGGPGLHGEGLGCRAVSSLKFFKFLLP